MRWMDRPVPARQYTDELPPVETMATVDGRLATIERRGTMRVGYLPDSLPFAFRNQKGEVVGFDVEMANHLAGDLGVGLEMVRIELGDISRLLESGQVDIVMSGMVITPTRAKMWAFGAAPIDLSLAFLVRDYRRKEFSTMESVLNMKDLKLGVVQNDEAFDRRILNAFPEASVVNIKSPRDFLKGVQPELDAVVYSAEGGSAWTLIYPDFNVVVPQPLSAKVPMGYPLPTGDAEWSRFISTWVELEKKNGSVGHLFEHWIRGGGAKDTEPRWSIIRDVLHWVE